MTKYNNFVTADESDFQQKKGEDAVKGIEKRVGKNGCVSYRVKIRLKGHQAVSKTFMTMTHAKKWKKHTETQIEQGLYFDNKTKHTLEEAIDKYIETILPSKPRNAVNTKRHLSWWKEKLGHCFLSGIKPSVITECRDELLEGLTPRNQKRSPTTVVRYLSSLSHVFSVAERDWGWMQDNPVKKITKPQESRGRTRYLNGNEIQTLLQACKESKSKDLYAVVILALSTGMRRSELLWLRWKQVNFERGFLVLENTKNDEPRIIPLEGLSYEILKERFDQSFSLEDLVFPAPTYKEQPIDIRSAWEYALKVSGIKEFRFHDLRHSCASLLAMNGYNLLDIAKLLGHKDLQSTQRYSHLSHEYTRKMMQNLNRNLFENNNK